MNMKKDNYYDSTDDRDDHQPQNVPSRKAQTRKSRRTNTPYNHIKVAPIVAPIVFPINEKMTRERVYGHQNFLSSNIGFGVCKCGCGCSK